MPTISRFFGIAIVMFFDDHGFPHFQLAMPKEKPRCESTIWRSWTAASVAANCDSSSPGQSSIRKNWKRTGAEPAPVRHFWISSL
jgi:hypothetical protein